MRGKHIERTVYLTVKERDGRGEDTESSFHVHVYAKDVLPTAWADLGTRAAAIVEHAREFQDVVNAATVEAAAQREPIARVQQVQQLRQLAQQLREEADRLEVQLDR